MLFPSDTFMHLTGHVYISRRDANIPNLLLISQVRQLQMQTTSLSSCRFVEKIYQHGEGRQEPEATSHIWQEQQS